MSITAKSAVESLAACLLGEARGIPWGDALHAIRSGDYQAYYFGRLAARAIDHMPYIGFYPESPDQNVARSYSFWLGSDGVQ
jgi:hypothetical protein